MTKEDKGVDEVMSVIFGRNDWYHYIPEEKKVAKVELQAGVNQGWVMIFAGGNPHCSHLHGGLLLGQIIGADFEMIFKD